MGYQESKSMTALSFLNILRLLFENVQITECGQETKFKPVPTNSNAIVTVSAGITGKRFDKKAEVCLTVTNEDSFVWSQNLYREIKSALEASTTSGKQMEELARLQNLVPQIEKDRDLYKTIMEGFKTDIEFLQNKNAEFIHRNAELEESQKELMLKIESLKSENSKLRSDVENADANTRNQAIVDQLAKERMG